MALYTTSGACAADEVRTLAGPWRFAVADDPAFAAPAFDDSRWDERSMPHAWPDGGYPETGQLAWYRLRVAVDGATGALALRAPAIRSAWELYADGRLLGAAGAMPPTPSEDHDRRPLLPLPAAALEDGEVVLALRVWGGSDLKASASVVGPRSAAPVLGPLDRLQRDATLGELPALIAVAQFLLAAVFFGYLYLRNAELDAFRWFAVTAAVFSVYVLTQSEWKFALGLDFVTLERTEGVTWFLTLALTPQLIWSLLRAPGTWWLRTYQAVFCVLALVYAFAPDLDVQYRLRSVWQFVSLMILPPLALLLVRGVLSGERAARALALGIAVFAICAIADLLANLGLRAGPSLMSFGFGGVLLAMGYVLADQYSLLLTRLQEQVALRTGELSAANTELAAANERLLASARTDSLTGLLNRRGFEDEVERETQRLGRGASPFAVLLIDIDHFKRFNDRHGHACGDDVLRAVAAALAHALREVDRAARWGGEEFLVLLPQASAQGLVEVGEKLRAAIARQRIEADGASLSVTATIGGAILADGESFEAVLARADAALYRGKAEGRDRFVVS